VPKRGKRDSPRLLNLKIESQMRTHIGVALKQRASKSESIRWK